VAEPLRLVVWSPSETVLERDGVAWVHVELVDSGGLTVWPGHLPVIGEMSAAALRYEDADGEHAVSLPPGVVHVDEGVVTVFLAGGIDQPQPEGVEGVERFERLAEEMVASLPNDAVQPRRADSAP
jgi:F0F1-type ATP synthase epsilon subunit